MNLRSGKVKEAPNETTSHEETNLGPGVRHLMPTNSSGSKPYSRNSLSVRKKRLSFMVKSLAFGLVGVAAFASVVLI